MNAFSRIDPVRFLKGLFPAFALVLILGWFAQGLIASVPSVRTALPNGESLPFLSEAGPFATANAQRRNFWSSINQVPAACLSGEGSQFQRQQCERYWFGLGEAGLLAFLPLLITIIFYGLMFNSAGRLFARIRKVIKDAKPAASGKVTHPALLPNDLFARFFGLQRLSVQLSNQKQVAVYVPNDGHFPRPGEVLLVYDVGSVFLKKRWVGVLYAPHVAVIRAGSP